MKIIFMENIYVTIMNVVVKNVSSKSSPMFIDITLLSFEHNEQFKNGNPLIYYIRDKKLICDSLEVFNSKYDIIGIDFQ